MFTDAGKAEEFSKRLPAPEIFLYTPIGKELDESMPPQPAPSVRNRALARLPAVASRKKENQPVSVHPDRWTSPKQVRAPPSTPFAAQRGCQRGPKCQDEWIDGFPKRGKGICPCVRSGEFQDARRWSVATAT